MRHCKTMGEIPTYVSMEQFNLPGWNKHFTHLSVSLPMSVCLSVYIKSSTFTHLCNVYVVHPQNVQLHNVQLQNVQLPNVLLQNVQDTKRPGYKTSSYQTSSYRTSRIQNVQDTKRPVFFLI
jgi:hypothetical protein